MILQVHVAPEGIPSGTVLWLDDAARTSKSAMMLARSSKAEMLVNHCCLARYLMQWHKQADGAGREAPSSAWCSIGHRVPIISHDQQIGDEDI